MKQRKRVEWTRLDNASKIFPATYTNKDTKVFRLVCELKEPVDPGLLQKALDMTLNDFPLYRSVLRKGVFWYYFETTDLPAKVEMESLPVCAPLYRKDNKTLLFRVSYFHQRINLEVFHALSDGTGALWFIKTLVSHYLFLRHEKVFANKTPKLNYNASISKKMDDSFGRYFVGHKPSKAFMVTGDKLPRAFRVRGSRLEENRIKITEGSMSAKAVLEEAHKYHTTLTVFISSLFIYSIYKEMPARGMNLPITLSIPINLRQFFESETTRNFFSTMYVGYHFKDNTTGLTDIIQSVSESFKRELTQQKLSLHLNRLIAWENNPLARIVPLPLKDSSLRLVNKITDRGVSAAISNIGRIPMPEELEPYIDKFSVYTSARRPQICMCSYGDKLVVSFSSPFRETEIERTFFQYLANKGIEIEIASNS